MSPEAEEKSLLDALRGLYSKMAMLVLHKRMGSYRPYGGVDVGGDIASTLSAHIRKVAEAHQGGAQAESPPTFSRTVHPRRHHAETIAREPQTTEAQRPFTPGELTKHFEASRAGAVFDPHLGTDLKRRTWEHIHAALRYAAQGQARTAKLHADLATSAFKEAAHYLSDEEITEFAAAVENKLKDISVPPGKTSDS
ncbi:MAG: hypothetical protein JSW10_00210 [Pseudomonadota bacterium]|nr:MAG: hypothetical protein JSW10_00210 [Pseudomonadota bacterium]